jgi:hypothetical protein
MGEQKENWMKLREQLVRSGESIPIGSALSMSNRGFVVASGGEHKYNFGIAGEDLNCEYIELADNGTWVNSEDTVMKDDASIMVEQTLNGRPCKPYSNPMDSILLVPHGEISHWEIQKLADMGITVIQVDNPSACRVAGEDGLEKPEEYEKRKKEEFKWIDDATHKMAQSAGKAMREKLNAMFNKGSGVEKPNPDLIEYLNRGDR